MTFFAATTITPKELEILLSQGADIILLDVREADEFNFCKISGSVNISLRNLGPNLQKVEKDKPVVLICHHGVRSMQALTVLKEHGFIDIASLEGGLERWAIEIDQSMSRY